MRKGMMLLIGGLTLLAGCGNQGTKNAGVPVEPKWKGPAYRLAFDTQAGKPNPAEFAIPAVKYTANPDALETRAILVLKFEATGPTVKEPVESLMIGTAADIHGAEGTLPADYMEKASKGMADYLENHCLTGKVKLSVALARSSLDSFAGADVVDTKRLSDWLPTELVYKNPHSKCR